MDDRLTLLDEGIDALRIAPEVSEDGGDILHSTAILMDLRRSKFLDKRTLNFVILEADFSLSHFEFARR